MKYLALALAIALAGCNTIEHGYAKNSDIEAQLPRAQGLGAFAGSCWFLCFVHAQFSQGDVTPVEVVDDEDGKVKAHTDVTLKLKTDTRPDFVKALPIPKVPLLKQPPKGP